MEQKSTPQMDKWSTEFGKSYTDRNPQSVAEMDALYTTNFGVTRQELNKDFLGDMDRNIRILEVGSNVGSQLMALQELGFKNLYGVELQSYAVEISKKRSQGINLIQGSAFELPFRDGFFDLVFTSGVLIHISPTDLPKAISEMIRCSKRWIWGFEYYAETHREVPYRGHSALLWKGDFAGEFRKQASNLKFIRDRKVPYLNSPEGNVDVMYLLEKHS